MSDLSMKLSWWAAGFTWAGLLLPYDWWVWVSGAGFVCLVASIVTAWVHAHRRLKELGSP